MFKFNVSLKIIKGTQLIKVKYFISENEGGEQCALRPEPGSSPGRGALGVDSGAGFAGWKKFRFLFLFLND